MERYNRILIQACDLIGKQSSYDFQINEIDTSCPYVPFGYVTVIQMPVGNESYPDEFWAACLAVDGNIELMKAVIRPLESNNVSSMLSVICEDISRVSPSTKIGLPGNIKEGFVVVDACNYCCGGILLLESDDTAFYIHWHRES